MAVARHRRPAGAPHPPGRLLTSLYPGAPTPLHRPAGVLHPSGRLGRALSRHANPLNPLLQVRPPGRKAPADTQTHQSPRPPAMRWSRYTLTDPPRSRPPPPHPAPHPPHPEHPLPAAGCRHPRLRRGPSPAGLGGAPHHAGGQRPRELQQPRAPVPLRVRGTPYLNPLGLSAFYKPLRVRGAPYLNSLGLLASYKPLQNKQCRLDFERLNNVSRIKSCRLFHSTALHPFPPYSISLLTILFPRARPSPTPHTNLPNPPHQPPTLT